MPPTAAFSSAPLHASATFILSQAARPLLTDWLNDANTTVRQYMDAQNSTTYDYDTPRDHDTGISAQDGHQPTNARSYTDSVLESDIVHMLARLILLLVPSTEPVTRTAVLLHILNLACLLGNVTTENISDMRTMIVTRGLASNAALTSLLKCVGPSLHPVAVPIVPGLASFLTHPDSAVRAVAALAITQLLSLHSALFEQADRLAVVWDLLFALTSNYTKAPRPWSRRPKSSLLSTPSAAELMDRSDRRLLIESLGTLSFVFDKEMDLVSEIAGCLFQLSVKTAPERMAIQATLKQLAEIPNVDLPHIIVEQIRPEDDDALDMVPWAVTKLAPDAPFPELLDAHMMSPQPAVRYGCALVMATYCCTHPEHVPALSPMITLGYHDQCSSVALVYRSLIHELGAHPQTLVESYNNSCPSDLIERVATGIEFSTDTADRLSALAFLDLWALKIKTSTQLPILLIQSLISCLRVHDNKVRIAALGVLAKLFSSITGPASSPKSSIHTHVKLIWAQLCTLPSSMWSLDVGLFPALAPALRTQPDFFPHLLSLVLNSAPPTRISIYSVLKSMAKNASPSETTLAVGLLVLALGDMNYGALVAASEALSAFKPGLGSLLNQLCHSHLGICNQCRALSLTVAIWDELVTAAVDLGLLSQWITLDSSMDYVWNYYLGGLSENVVAPSPDDYEFARALDVHSPLWLGLVLHRLSVPPPPTSNITNRREVPALSTLRRRFHCGFLLVMFPLLGYPDISIRQAACTAATSAIFRGNAVSNLACKSLMDYITTVLSSHKSWPYVCSALDIASIMLQTKVPNVSQFLLHWYLGNAIDWGVNSPSIPIRVASLGLLDTMCAIFPQGVSSRLTEVRDTARQCLVDRDPLVASAAAQLWTRVLSIVSEASGPSFVSYIYNEVLTIHSRSPVHLQADPLLQNLTIKEQKRLVSLHMNALGFVGHPSLAPKIVQTCLPMLSSPCKIYRRYALIAVLKQCMHLAQVDKLVAGWACIPLFVDTAACVCSIFDAYMSKGFRFGDQVGAKSTCTPHPDDAIAPISPSLDEIFNGQTSYSISPENRVHTHHGIHDAKFAEPPLTSVPKADAQSLDKMRSLISALAGKVSVISEPQVMYYFERATDNHHLLSGALMTLAEFCRMHESTMSHVVGILLRHIETRNEVAVHAIVRLCQDSPSTFHHVLNALLSLLANSSELQPGIIECLRLLVPMICDIDPEKGDYILACLIPNVIRGRFGLESRLLVANLITDILVHPKFNANQTPDRANLAVNFLDSLHGLIIKGESDGLVYDLLRRLLAVFHPSSHPHSLFSHLKEQAMKFVFEGSEKERLEAIDMMSCAFLDEEDSILCKLLFLADDQPNVVLKATRVLSLSPLLEYVQKCGSQYLLKLISQIVAIWVQLAHRTSASSYEGVGHLFAVMKRLFQVADADSGKQVQTILIDHLRLASAHALRLRAAQFDTLSRSPLGLEEYAGIRIVQTAEGLVLPRTTSKPMMGIDKESEPGGGNTNDVKSLINPFESHRAYLLGDLAERQTELDFWVHSQTQLLLILGYARALRPDIFIDHLRDEHRGVRAAAVEALLTLEMDVEVVNSVISSSLQALNNDSSNGSRLYCRKLDHLQLAVSLGRKFRLFEKQVLDALVVAWRDPIQSVRESAICLVRHVGQFDADETSRLMEAIGAHISQDDYPEQFALQELMTWFIAQMHC